MIIKSIGISVKYSIVLCEWCGCHSTGFSEPSHKAQTFPVVDIKGFVSDSDIDFNRSSFSNLHSTDAWQHLYYRIRPVCDYVS